MGQKPETYIVNQIQEFVFSRKGYITKLHGNIYSKQGEVDLIGWVPAADTAVPFAVEVKMPKEKPRPLQLYRVSEWKRSGVFAAGVVTSLDDFIDLIRDQVGIKRFSK